MRNYKKIVVLLGFLVMLVFPSKLYSSVNAATAENLKSGVNLTKTIKVNEEHDYIFTTNKDGEVYLSLDKTSGGMYLELQDVYGEHEVSEYIYSGGDEAYIKTKLLKGTYHVIVKPYDWDGKSSSKYNLKVTFPGKITRNETSFEPNETFETAYALTNGKSTNSTLESNLDVDKYKFTTNKDGQIYITLDGSSAGANLKLYDEYGNSEYFSYEDSYSEGAGSAKISVQAVKGTYYVEVSPYGWNAVSSSNYRIKATFAGSFKRDANLESNDTFETAYPVISGKSYTSHSFSNLDIDMFKFSTSKAGKVTVRLDEGNENYLVELYNLYGKEITSYYVFSGESQVIIEEKLEKGTYFVKVIPYDWNGVTSSNYRIYASFQDKIPTVNSISNLATVIKGEADTGAKVYAYVGSKLLGSTTASNGKYTIKIAKQKAKTAVKVYTVDKQGIQSRNKNITVIDKTPKVNSLSNLATVIKGGAETGAKVNAYVGKKLIGSTTASSGKYTIKIAKQKVNTTVAVHIVDKSGVKSASRSVKVVNKTPKVNGVSTQSKIITGGAETGAKVYAYAGTKLLGSATAVDGNYKVKISKQKVNTTIAVHIVDKSGVKSASKDVKVIDKTPKVNAVSNASTTIKGSAETSAKVYAYVGKKLIGSTTASSGKYTIKIAKQKANVKIAVHIVDKSGVKSASRTVTVTDKIAPIKPTVSKVTTKSNYISGKTEASAKVYIYNGKKNVATGKANSKGNYKVKITKQKKGATIKVHALDAAKNKSKVTSVKVK